jgi:hypothetical protein
MILSMNREQSLGKSKISGERRDARRYDIRLNLKWKLVRRRKTLESGEGFTVDISSSGMQFEAGKTLPLGFQVDLSIAWPVLLHMVSPLQLKVTGHVARSIDGRTAIRIDKHEFRTLATAVADSTKMVPVRTPPDIASYAPLQSGMASGYR